MPQVAFSVRMDSDLREGRIPFEVSSHRTAPMIAASASQMLRIMQALSSEAQEAGVADMSLDEINAAKKGV